MTHISLPTADGTSLRNGAKYNDAMTRMAGELIEKFRVSPAGLTTGSWSLLTEILDFAVEAEQTIAEQNRKIEELESLAISDPLTGLLNRRGLEMELDHAVARNRRHAEPGLFVYIDLDNFKEINDSYGHAAGDALIRHVAHLLKGSIRQTDYAGRLGGDEFGLLLSHCDSKQFSAAHLLYIRRRLEKSPLEFEGLTLRAGASFGIARITPDSNREDILNQADEQMYFDKRARRRAKEDLSQIMAVGAMAE
ncbi:GGDEF domain-containing protein [Emcibacter nanhaiensis]|uniref:diguanylate cyclase n=1 Tax=Emcibacter nanhaiensis TaxID=1505037 RepID=A0A501PTR9_9PROT|nr:GGDEF domain-containing protein [Emcibacter nanhaiensis]TPD63176.1 GGDEF domain-containing protein [Emcibacter nanhaiensis]